MGWEIIGLKCCNIFLPAVTIACNYNYVLYSNCTKYMYHVLQHKIKYSYLCCNNKDSFESG